MAAATRLTSLAHAVSARYWFPLTPAMAHTSKHAPIMPTDTQSQNITGLTSLHCDTHTVTVVTRCLQTALLRGTCTGLLNVLYIGHGTHISRRIHSHTHYTQCIYTDGSTLCIVYLILHWYFVLLLALSYLYTVLSPSCTLSHVVSMLCTRPESTFPVGYIN